MIASANCLLPPTHDQDDPGKPGPTGGTVCSPGQQPRAPASSPPQVLKDHLVPRVKGPLHFGAEDDMTYYL